MEIERHYRKKQHKMLVNLNPNKRFIYWMNMNEINIEPGDVVHWWGGGMPFTKHEIIISQYGPFYLDMGVGNYLGVSYGNYQTWLDLYNQDLGKMIENYDNKDKVIGAEVCLWSELSN
jgi:Glycosyl hydrolase family 20, catalytic domain